MNVSAVSLWWSRLIFFTPRDTIKVATCIFRINNNCCEICSSNRPLCFMLCMNFLRFDSFFFCLYRKRRQFNRQPVSSPAAISFFTAIADAFCKYRAERVALHGADKKQQAVLFGTVCWHVAWGDTAIRRGRPPTRSCLSLPTEPPPHFAARGERGYCTNSWSSVTSRVMKEMRSICCQLLD